MRENSRIHSRKLRATTLLLAKRLGVSKASQESGISRSTIYEWKQRLEEHGSEGLAPLPPTPRSHPQAIAESLKEQIRQLALAHPGCGCDRIEELLGEDAPYVSSTTIQKVLNRSKMGTRVERWLALERLAAREDTSLSVEQHDFVSDRNPCFPKCSYRSRGPGDVIHAGVWPLGKSERGNEVYVLAMVDACSAYAFGAIFEDRRMSPEVSLLDIKVRKFYLKRNVRVHKILIADSFNFPNVGLYSSAGSLVRVGPFLKMLKRPPIGRPCCLLRFQKIVISEFLRGPLRRKKNINVDANNREFQRWLQGYNWSRAHEGYPNWGKIPGHVFG